MQHRDSTLAEAVGRALQNPCYVEILMPLTNRWSRLNDDDEDMITLLECVATVTIAIGVTFVPYAQPVFELCNNIIHQSLLKYQVFQQNPDMEEPDKSFLVKLQNAHSNAPPEPVTPEEYRTAHTRRRGVLEKAPPPAVREIQVRELRMPGPFPLLARVTNAPLLSALLGYWSFYKWYVLSAVTKEIRMRLVGTPELREAALERYLVGHARWAWGNEDPLELSLLGLHDYMRGGRPDTRVFARWYVYAHDAYACHSTATGTSGVRGCWASRPAEEVHHEQWVCVQPVESFTNVESRTVAEFWFTRTRSPTRRPFYSYRQCQRRALKCEYPAESRRGMRKKKVVPEERELLWLISACTTKRIQSNPDGRTVANVCAHRWKCLLAHDHPYADDGPGELYVQGRYNANGLLELKVGETSDMARHWNDYCKCLKNGHTLHWEFHCHIPHCKLAERLVHLSFRALGGVQVHYSCPGCRVRHREFYSLENIGDLEAVVRVLEFWIIALGGTFERVDF
ncbi:hypothetical protein K438DRAFT_1997611 [Mycena galopus ATCC 62051]|nr:hypothetical protein K438DRAFT_1997611 [Mycena galopus ATCC 62051]